MPEAPLLVVKDLTVAFPGRREMVRAVRGVSFSMGREKLGIVGESGSGKSVTGRTLLGLTRKAAEVRAETLSFDGIDLLRADEKTWRRIRGRRISMVMQDPIFSLNPVMSVGSQIAEACRLHSRLSRGAARHRALGLLEAVRIRDPRRVFHLYPHEVSGGMGQRIMIAMMIAAGPDLLIADEPTSALDVTVRIQILAILDDLVTRRGMGLIFISHDLNLVAAFCDRVLIMYGGRILETCPADRLHEARHPYTRGLLSCMPEIGGPGGRLPTLERDPAWLAGDERS
ncbi:ABC transporter ATP-binding protein [Desulfococcus sp.]|uniref:ABC transporter ATP-binding protein n=1 Tax=Desulfococcus sp. TaxID=2025834 RepID=UPI0035949235